MSRSRKRSKTIHFSAHFLACASVILVLVFIVVQTNKSPRVNPPLPVQMIPQATSTREITTVRAVAPLPTVAPIPKNAVPLVIFTQPITGTTIDRAGSTTISWRLVDPELLLNFPDFDIFFSLIDSDGLPGGIITIARADTASYTWNVAHMSSVFPSFYSSTKKYKIRVHIEYAGLEPFTCLPGSATSSFCVPHYNEPLETRIREAKRYMSESDFFSIR